MKKNGWSAFSANLTFKPAKITQIRSDAAIAG
jgi:hypothetical protein